MRTSNSFEKARSNHLGWYLLAKYPLGEMMPDDGCEFELTAGFLFQLFQELGVPPELIRKIEWTLTGFAEQNRLERPACFRIFCQKKVIDNANAAKTSGPDHAESTMKAAPSKDPSGMIPNRSWGYFIIEKSGGVAGSCETSSLCVDLYLYQEGA